MTNFDGPLSAIPEKYPRGEQIAEGKTKKIYDAKGHPNLAVVEYKDDITAHNDPALTQQFEGKAEYSNKTNAGVFELLNAAGIPTAFRKKLSGTEFLTEKCTMIPLEVVVRRYAVGSYTVRHPEYVRPKDKEPHLFPELKNEFFLKTTRGSLKTASGETLVTVDDPINEEDPLIGNPFDSSWKLLHPKKKVAEADLKKDVESAKVASVDQMRHMEKIVKETFEVLEAFFAKNGHILIDFKVEFGITSDGRLVVADVIDNDSWRLRDTNWNEVSKQVFRDGGNLEQVKNVYKRVADMF